MPHRLHREACPQGSLSKSYLLRNLNSAKGVSNV